MRIVPQTPETNGRSKHQLSECFGVVAVQYSLDRNEYEKVGGTRESERKRPVREAPKAA